MPDMTEFTVQDMDRVNEWQDRIVETLGIGYVDPSQNLMQMARGDVLRLEGRVTTLTEELLVANAALQVSSSGDA